MNGEEQPTAAGTDSAGKIEEERTPEEAQAVECFETVGESRFSEADFAKFSASEQLLNAIRNDCERWTDGPEFHLTEGEYFRGLQQMIDKHLVRKRIFLVMQQGGGTTEWYTHMFDTPEDAKRYMEDDNPYTCVGPFEVPADFDHPDIYDLITNIVEQCVEAA